jgi:hypothetical protein
MVGTASQWTKNKGNRGHTSISIHYEWIVYPRNPKHTSFRILWHGDWHGLVGFPLNQDGLL